MENKTDEDSMPEQRDEGNSFFRWLVALGLPLVLLALFVFHQQTKNANPQTTPTITSQLVGDPNIVTTIRQAIHDNNSLSNEAKAVTVDAADGVITLKGAVPSNAERALIEQIAKNTNGTVKVINEIEVKQER